MLDLRPCPQCQRHVAITEAACPFCETALGAATAPRVSPVGRLSRAAVFAAGALVTTACGGSKAKPDDKKQDTQTQQTAPVPADAAENTPPPPPPPDYDRHMNAKPYGAPPARRRLV